MNKSIFCTTLVAGGTIASMSFAGVAQAGTAQVEVNIPRAKVAEYHRPYVAGWVEDVNGASKGTLFVWYDAKNRENNGQKWLKDMRAWWRKGGRDIKLPNGLSSATRAPGRQVVSFNSNNSVFKYLGKGQYVFVVEAAREGGGREMVKVPFTWNGNSFGAQAASGHSELGRVAIGYTK